MATDDLTARYRPSTATIAMPAGHGRPARTIGLRKRRVPVMLVLTILTLGAYPAIWLLRRRRVLNTMDSPRKIAPWAATGVLCLFAVGFAAGIVRDPDTRTDTLFDSALAVIQLGLAIWFLVDLFGVKQILEDHVAPASSDGFATTTRLEVSGLLTFFLSVFYLQYIINREFVGRVEASGD